MRKAIRWGGVFLALIACLVPTALAVEAEEGKLAITSSGVEDWDGGAGKIITLNFDNRTGSTVSPGWAGSCRLILETDEDAFALLLNSTAARIEPGVSTQNFALTPCTGTVETVTLTELVQLSADGLPERKLTDVVIDLAAEEPAVQCDFSLAPTVQEEFFNQGGVDPASRPSAGPTVPTDVRQADGFASREKIEQEQGQGISEAFDSILQKSAPVLIILVFLLIPVIVLVDGVLYHKQRKNDFASVAPFAVPPEISGAKRGERWIFSRKDITEEDFIQRINLWFLAHPKLALTRCRFTCGMGEGVFTHRSYLNALELQYDLLERDAGVCYAVAALTRLGLRAHSGEELTERWQASHPEAKILRQQELLHQRGEGGVSPDGAGDSNFTQVYLLYQTERIPHSDQGEDPASSLL